MGFWANLKDEFNELDNGRKCAVTMLAAVVVCLSAVAIGAAIGLI